MLTVRTESTKDEIGIQTLVGDYTEKGTNHGKKVYQKTQKIPGHEDINVFLYYWDNRDGADFSGWWFGDQVGGSQVWARCTQHGPMPPKIGWRIPWDSATAEPGILFVEPSRPGGGAAAPAGAQAGAQVGAQAVGTVTPANLQARLKAATAKVDAVERTGNAAITAAKGITQASPAEKVTEAQQNLQKQQTALMEVQKALTQDITEARKGGPTAVGTVTELSKLSPRLRTLQTGLGQQLMAIKATAAKVQGAATSAANKAAQEAALKATAERNKVQEAKDSKEFNETLPATQELVAGAEDAVEACGMMAAPLIADPPEDSGDILKKAMEEIEASAAEAQTKIADARKEINTKLQAARKYAPETRKTALTEFSTLQQKLTEAQKKVNPYRTFKKDFHARVEARKSLSEIAEKLSAAELEVEKASMMSSAAEHGQMSEEEIASVEKVLQPARAGVDGMMRQLDEKMRKATSDAVKQELQAMKDKAAGSKKTVDSVAAVLKRQRESLSTKDMLRQASEKVDAAEATLAKCQEAEMPFLKGIEILPAEESTTAIKESEAASVKADQAFNSARSFLRLKIQEAKKYVKELAASVTEELTAHQTRLEEAGKKLANFKKETTERKMAALLAEAVDCVHSTEKKVKALVEAAEVFSSDSLDTVSVATLKEAIEKTSEAEKAASASMLEVRKVMSAKQREARGPDATAALSKLQAKINAAQQDMAKTRKAAATGEKLIKGKEVLAEETATIAKCEERTNKSEKKVKPGEEEAALGIEAGTATDAEIEEMGTTLTEDLKSLKASSRLVEANMATAPESLKTALKKLSERSKAVVTKINEVMALTKDQRERVMSEAYVREGKSKVEEVDKKMAIMDEAELPFLKGVEVLPLQETNDAMKASEDAAQAAHAAIGAARTYIASKNLETKTYGEASAKPAAEALAGLTERINTAAGKLAQFRKDTEARKKTALMQEAGEKIAAVEKEVKEMGEATKPFLEEGEEQPEEACEKVVALMRSAMANLSAARGFLAARQREAAGPNVETVKELQKRLAEATAEMRKHQQVAQKHEGKYIAKKLMQETDGQLQQMRDHLDRGIAAAAPIVEENGLRFLVAASVRSLAAAWREHIKAKGTTVEELYSEVTKGGADKASFVTHLAGLPAALDKEELGFSDERREAMFAHIDADGDGRVSQEEFKEIFKQRFVCVKEVTVTDAMDVTKSKTICKLEGGEQLETCKGPQTDESTGMTRIECTLVSSGKTGFITMQGSSGTEFLRLVSPFTTFCQELEKKLEDVVKEIGATNTWFNEKTKELTAQGKDSNVFEARQEFNKKRKVVIDAQSSINKLKAQLTEGKREFAKKELAEKNAHIDAREKKAADEVAAPAREQFQKLEEALKQVEEGAKTLTALNSEELLAFSTPNSVLAKVTAAEQALLTAAKDTKEAVTKQQAELPKMAKGHMLEVRKELMKMSTQSEAMKKRAKVLVDTTRAKCQDIIQARMPEIATVLRAQQLEKGITHEQFFAQLAEPGQGTISEDALCTHISGSLPNLLPEHVRLVVRNIEVDGVSRRKFQNFLQQYYVVVKSVAFTNDFEIKGAKTLRKADMDELVELLEGPRLDEKLNVTRIKAKSLADGTTGWLSLTGNQGSAFLQEVEKPYYTARKEIETTDLGGNKHVIKIDEVLELLEGPRKENRENGVRVRGKAISDGVMGWFTVRDQTGTVFAEAGTKYYSCTSSVAMTDHKDIKDCKVIRKLAVGELFTVDADPTEEKEAGVTRVQGKSLKDEQVGWITIKGNAGTVYAEPSSKHYCVLKEVPLTKKFPSSDAGEEVRKLAKGEAMQVLEGPKEEVFAPVQCAKVRCTSDGVEGWITVEVNKNVKTWTPYYKCKIAAPMHDQATVEGSKVLRDIAVGEDVEFLKGVEQDGQANRIRVKAAKDGLVGWVTVRDENGKRPFEC